MSKIADDMHRIMRYRTNIKVEDVIENYSIKDIKEYITYLFEINSKKDEEIKKLIVENVRLQDKLKAK